MFRSTLALSLLFLGLSPLAQAQPVGRTTTYAVIRCESLDRRDSYCPADTRRGVYIVRELSGGRCRIGSSWGYDRGGIWVDRGCRAEFEIGRYSGGGYGWGWGYQGDDYIVCASRDFRQQHCPANTRGGVRLINQISRTPCQQGTNWDFDVRGVWVGQGCAGEFEIGRGGGYDDPAGGHVPPPHGGGVVLCESKDNRRRFCPADLGGAQVTVLRNISRVPCQLDLNWGYDERGVWVDRGCRARFGVVGGGDPEWDAGGNHGRNEVIRCASEDHRRNFCAAPNNGGVRLLRQISRSPCVEGESWGYDDRRLWVEEGCEGEFELLGRYR